MNTVYMDLEYDNNFEIIEIGAVAIENRYIINLYHSFIRRPLTNTIKYIQSAQHCHCIHPSVLNYEGVTMDFAMIEFENFFNELEGHIILKGYGDDMMKSNLEELFPFLRKLKIKFQQVELPPWKERQFLKPHISALNLKNATKLLPCHQRNHSLKFSPCWKYKNMSPNESKIARYTYGFHCSLVDSLECSFFDNAIDLYSCDKQFSKIFLCNFNNPFEPTYLDNNSYFPLIQQDPLVFSDV